MIKSKIIKGAVLSLFVLSVVLVAVSATPANAMREESCYTISNFSSVYCTCTQYVCLISGSEQWNGGTVPYGGSYTRWGEHCSNGSGWSSNIGEWGNVGYCYGM